MKHLFLVIFVVLALSMTASAQTELRVGSAAPQFSGADLDGTQYDLSQLRGQVVVLTFWSTRCVICKEELPKVNQIVRSYQGKNVVFLSLTSDAEAKVRNYLIMSPTDAHVIPNSFGTLLAYADKDKDGNLNFGYPAFYVIDKEGRIAYKGSGWDRTAPLGSAINALLGL